MRTKDANNEEPTMKLNDENKEQTFAEFKMQVHGWAQALSPFLKRLLKTYEAPDNRNKTEVEIAEEIKGEMKEMAERKYEIFVPREDGKRGRNVQR